MITFERKTFEQARLAKAERKGFFFAIVAFACFVVCMLAVTPLYLPLGWAIVVIFALLLASFGASYWLFYGRWQQQWQPRRDDRDRWAEATATVLKTETSVYEGNYGKKWTRYFLLIRFPVNDLEIHLHARVDKPFYDRTQTGDSLPIRYDPEDLSVALLAGEPGFDDLAISAQ